MLDNILILRGSAATDLRTGDLVIGWLQFLPQFVYEYKREIIITIGPHLPGVIAEIKSAPVFMDDSV